MGDLLRPRLATSRNRVLRGPGATPAAKRTQGACRPRDRAPKGKRLRSRRGFLSGRQYRWSRQGEGSEVRRGRRAGHVRKGPPGTWEISFSPPESWRCGHRVRKEPRPDTRGVHGCRERKQRGARVEPRREGNEAQRGGEKSEPLSSTDEAGELSPEDPVEGRRRSVYGASRGKDDTDIGP